MTSEKNKELEERLVQWGKEYGGKDNPRIGWPSQSTLQTVSDHHGFAPGGAGFIPIPIRTAADEVEAIVRQMEEEGYFRPGRVLRCDYFQPNWAMDQRLTHLRKIGLPMSKAGYYDYLNVAKAYVHGALRRKKAA